MKTDTETKEIKAKVKIGEVEFTLPFKSNGGSVYDAKNSRIGNMVDMLERGYKDDYKVAQTIATALNEHFSRRWVKVSDGLPEKEGYYLVTFISTDNGDRLVAESYFDNGSWLEDEDHYEMDGIVIAWQDARLPDAYEENE